MSSTTRADADPATGRPPSESCSGLYAHLRATPATPVRRAATPVSFAAHDIVYREGDRVDALYVLRHGRVKLLSHLASGRARILRLLARGGVLGLSGLIDQPHAHTAQAIDEVSAWRVPLSALEQRIAAEPDLRDALLSDCLRELATADTWIRDFATGPIRGRIARLIAYLAALDGAHPAGALTLLTSEEMGEALGVTPESVSRVVAEFKRDGILAPVEGSDPLRDVMIKDPARLLLEADG